MSSEFSGPALAPAPAGDNITDLLLSRLEASPDSPLFSLPTEDGGWSDLTTREFHAQVTALAKGFIAAGILPGEKVGFICRTRYEWSVVDFALFFAGAVMVPIYETSSPAQIAFILKDSEATALICETSEHFSRFDEVWSDVPQVVKVWQLALDDLAKLSAAGAEVSDELLEQRRTAATGADLATLIYTSGSMGVPKGAMLTHANFIETSRSACLALGGLLTEGSSTLLFITMAHVFARFISIACIYSGVRVGHQPDTSQLVPALGSFRPTWLLAVPRVFEKVYISAEQTAIAGGNGRAFAAAADVAVKYSKALDAGRIPVGLRLRFAIFDRLVYRKLRAAMGGRVTHAISGSAPLGARLGHFFRAIGVDVLEGYGLTETTAPATVGRMENFKIGTVGTALPGVSIKLDEDSEVLIKGVDVFTGYWKNPELTAESFDGEWYRTGDLGTIDDEGFLTITGRKKEIIITAGGKNVAPTLLEDPLRANPVISQAVVVGDGKPFISALITLDPEMLPVWLANNGEPADMSLAEASTNPHVVAEVQRAVDNANERVSRAESIRKFTIITTEFTEANGYLTPKLSIKRGPILKDFSEVIDGMYASIGPETLGTSLRH